MEQKKTNKGLVAAVIIISVLIVLLLAATVLLVFGENFGLNVKSLFRQEPTTEPHTVFVMTDPVETTATAEPTTQEPEYEVPDILGMKATDAYLALNHAGVRFEVKREYSEAVKAEHVLRQEPEAGEMIKDSEKVLVIISKGVDETGTTPPPTTQPSTQPTTKKGDKQSSSSSGEYILDGSDRRYVSRSEVTPLNEQQLTYALNEIYARRGRKFNSQELQAYFNSKSWYKGTISPSQFDEGSLNEYEAANVQTILTVMVERGYR